MSLKVEDPNSSLHILTTHVHVFWIELFLYNSQEKEFFLYTINPTKKFLKGKGIGIGHLVSFNLLYIFKKYNNVIDFESPVVEQTHYS